MFTQHRLSLIFSIVFMLLIAASSLAQSEEETPTDSSPKEVSVGLKNGDIIRGSLAGENEKSIIVVSPILGTVTLPRDQVDSITEIVPPITSDSAAKNPTEADAASGAVEEVEKKAIPSPWSGSDYIGLTYAAASTLNVALNVGATIA